jgi:acetylornithine deacetylase/succinyl-diaminopimelate desuccinylase-like protein
MYNLLKSKNEYLKDELISLAQKLIRTPSPSLAESDVATLVEEELKRVPCDKVFRDGAGNVVGLLLGREPEPTVLLNCHMDTVPPQQESLWKESPYSGAIEGNRLYGLGAADCKGGLAAHIIAASLLKRSLLPLRGNLVIAATVAEENGCSVGVRHLLEKTLPDMNIHPTYAILGEPTGLGLYYGHDGWVEMDILVESRNPFLVDDAAHAIFNEYSNRNFDEPGMLTLHRPQFRNDGGRRCATIRMDRRMRTSESVGSILTQTKNEASMAAQATGAVAVAVAVRQENQRLYTGQTTLVRRVAHAWMTDPFHVLMERARQALSAADCLARPGKWALDRIGMGTAGSVLTRDFQVPTIGYGPGTELMAHALNESVDIGKISEAVYGTAAIVHSLIGIPVFGWTTDEI